MTRSSPIARPLRAFGSAEFLSPFPKRLKSPVGDGGEGEILHTWIGRMSMGQPF